MKIGVLLVDDERLARDRLRGLLECEDDVEIVGESRDGCEAVSDIERLRPDLLFLDVQMPGRDGFSVLGAIAPDFLPCTIFVTAFDRYALRAFDVHALDYLLKPFDRERFREALRRARDQLRRADAAVAQRLVALLQDAKKDAAFLERVVVKAAGRVRFVPVDEIDWMEAAGNYIRLHCAEAEHLVRNTMNDIEAKLDPNQFLRIHRSTIVNVARVRELQPTFHGEYVVVLHNGTELTLSRGYRDHVQSRLGTSL